MSDNKSTNINSTYTSPPYPGDLDSSFNGDGKVYPCGKDTFGYAEDVLETEDGTLYIAGRSENNYSIISLTKSGSFNKAFNETGVVTDNYKDGFYSAAKSIALTNNKLLVLGYYHENDETNHQGLASYNLDGSINSDFGNNGKTIVRAKPGRKTSSAPMLITSNSEGMLIGSTQTNTTNGSSVIVTYKLDSRGNLEEDSYKEITYQDTSTSAFSILALPNGKMLFCGVVHINNEFQGYISRYNSDLTPDVNFAKDGYFTISLPETSSLDDIKQLDGRIIAAGKAGYDPHGLIVSLTEDGKADTEFNLGSPLITRLDPTIQNVYFRSIEIAKGSNVITVLGAMIGGSEADIVLGRFLSDGRLDGSFGAPKLPKGWVRTKVGEFVDIPNKMIVQRDGKILVVGTWAVMDTFAGLRQFAFRYLG